jgi:hypothetical protein
MSQYRVQRIGKKKINFSQFSFSPYYLLPAVFSIVVIYVCMSFMASNAPYPHQMTYDEQVNMEIDAKLKVESAEIDRQVFQESWAREHAPYVRIAN